MLKILSHIKNKINFKKLGVFIFYLSLLLLSFGLGVKYNNLDHDLFSRLIRGYSVIVDNSIFYKDIVSYTQTHTWYDPEWITSGLLYLITEKFGSFGLIVLKCLSGFITILIIIFAIKQRLKNSKESPYNILFYVFILAVFASTCLLRYTIRCQNITFILLPLWILILEKIRNGNNKLIYTLPFIMLLWLNCHGGSIAGVGILFLYGVGEFLNKKPFKKYFIALIFVCLVYFINPWGCEFIKFILDSSYLDRAWIKEWRSPFENNGDYSLYVLYFVFFFTSIIAYILNLILKKQSYSKIDKTKLLILLVAGYLSVSARKHVELFTIICSIFIYEDFCFIYKSIASKIGSILKSDERVLKYIKTVLNTAIYTCIIVYSYNILDKIPLATSYYSNVAPNYPIRAVEFLRINDIKGNIIAHFHHSTYIAWKLYPNIKIYMDGRQEQVYSKQIFDDLMHFHLNKGRRPDRIMQKYPPDIFMIEPNWGGIGYFRDSDDWVEIYNDGINCIFIRKSLAKDNYKPVNDYDGVIIDDMFKSPYFSRRS